MLDRLRRHPSFHLAAYSASGGLITLLGLLFGPLILRKVGLAGYGELGLALFVSGVVATLADFGLQSHLLSLGARAGGLPRPEHVVESVRLRACLVAIGACAYAAYFLLFPHGREVRLLAGLYLLGLLFTPSQFEWYYLSLGRNRTLVASRLACAAVFAGLNLAWLASPAGIMALPLIMAAAQGAASAVLLRGLRPTPAWLAALRTLPSPDGVAALGLKLSPLAATQVLSFFFLGSGVFLLERLGAPGQEIGAYSIANRLIMGLVALIAPLILFFIPKSGPGNPPRIPARSAVLGAAALVLLAALGLATINVFYLVSGHDLAFRDYSLRVFLILMVGIAFSLIRVPWVSALVAAGRYRAYFLVHLAACVPILAVASRPQLLPEAAWVPWLACVPEALATAGSLLLGRHAAAGPARR